MAGRTLRWFGGGTRHGSDYRLDVGSGYGHSHVTLGIKPPASNEPHAFAQIPVFERVRRGGRSVGLFLGAVSRVAVMGERVCAGYAIRWEVQCFDRRGRLMSRTVRDVEPGRVTDADKEEVRKGYAAANVLQPPDKVKAALEQFQFADRRSAFGRFVPSASTGEPWVGEFVVLESFVPGRRGTVIPEKPTTWSVVGTDGSWVADVVLPAGFSLLDAGRNYVAGVELDQDDGERGGVPSEAVARLTAQFRNRRRQQLAVSDESRPDGGFRPIVP